MHAVPIVARGRTSAPTVRALESILGPLEEQQAMSPARNYS